MTGWPARISPQLASAAVFLAARGGTRYNARDEARLPRGAKAKRPWLMVEAGHASRWRPNSSAQREARDARQGKVAGAGTAEAPELEGDSGKVRGELALRGTG